MKNTTIRKFGYITVIILSTILILASLTSLVYDIPRWYLKILDFPRLQEMIVGIVLLIAFILLNKKWKIPSIALTIGLLASILIHFSILSPYLLQNKVVPTAIAAEINPQSTVGILIGNVLITNRNSKKFMEIIEKKDPDMILAMEVNSWWIEELQPLKKEYPYSMEYPAKNAYGMALYSKFRLTETEILFLSHSKVPSFNAIITLPSGKTFKFYGVHPVAPFPSDKYPTNIGDKSHSEKKEVALKKVGELVSTNTKPTIVAGDFNDVAWSKTSRLFGKNGNLKDVRIGRGLYNTFDAQSMIMRWPLDHFYVSENISVLDFETLPEFGSDHFPLFAKFQISGN